MFELTWIPFPLKLNEGPTLRYGYVPQRESLQFVTDFCDVVIFYVQSILLRFLGCRLLLMNFTFYMTRDVLSSVFKLSQNRCDVFVSSVVSSYRW